MTALSYVLIIFFSFGGFLVSFYIRHSKKQKHEKMVCPIGLDCGAVVHSKFSTFLGLPVELIGASYYAFIALSYGLLLSVPSLQSSSTLFALTVLSTCAFLFSCYLIFIQAVVIKEWCSWCLISAFLTAMIFAVASSNHTFDWLSMLTMFRPVILIAHVVAMSIGLGSATLTDVFFFKFLKDFKISEFEADVMHTLSQVIWCALGVAVLTGVCLYLPKMSVLHETSKFLVKMIVVTVLVINGAFLNLLIAPRLVKISFGEKHNHEPGELHFMRKVAFALGGISIVSWYSAFILGHFHSLPFDVWILLAIYFGILLCAVLGTQVFEFWMAKQARE